jgi:hypothetical protein
MHDLGGKREFFGPIDHTSGGPVFHAPWEARVFGVATFLQTLFGPNLDAFRAVMERLPRDQYVGPYYQRWLAVLEQTMRPFIEGKRSVPGIKVAGTARVLRYGMGRRRLPKFVNGRILPRIVGGARRLAQQPAFTIGDTVRVRSERAEGHTRQPAYVTGRTGTVIAHRGAAVFADRHAELGSKAPEHLYTVAFTGRELWGEAAEPNTEVRIELFEPYLEQA